MSDLTMTRKFALLVVQILALGIAAACSQSAGVSQQRSSPQAVIASATPDQVTVNYVALVHNYWIQYKSAEGDLDHISGVSAGPFGDGDAAKACFGLPSPRLPRDIELVNPPTCGRLSAAMLAVHENFLRDLESTPAPAKFAADDRLFRSELPKAIADLEAMISAASTGSKEAVAQATLAYVQDMMPTVTGALNDVDPSFVHN